MLKDTMLAATKKIIGKPFVRSVVVVASGTAAAQAISMAFSPIITRLYGPEAFGVQGTFLAVTAVLTPIAALSYPIAIILPKNDSDALEISRLSIIVALLFSIIAALIIFLFNQPVSRMLNIESISSYLWLIPVMMFLTVCRDVLQKWFVRKKQFTATARVALFQAIVISGAKAGIGCYYPIALVLVVLIPLGTALHAAMLAISAWRSKLLQVAQNGISQSSLLSLAKQHYDFPLYRAPQIFINAISQSLPVLMLASYFGPASAGFYTLGRTVLGMPSQLIGDSVAEVFYPKITEAAHNGENVNRHILKASLALGALGLVPFGSIIVFGPWLFKVIFGVKWVIAGEYARWLAIWLYFSFINRPSVAAIATLSLQGLFLVYEIMSVLVRVAVIFIGFKVYSSDIVAVALFSIAGAVLNIILVVVTLLKTSNTKNNIITHE